MDSEFIKIALVDESAEPHEVVVGKVAMQELRLRAEDGANWNSSLPGPLRATYYGLPVRESEHMEPDVLCVLNRRGEPLAVERLGR